MDQNEREGYGTFERPHGHIDVSGAVKRTRAALRESQAAGGNEMESRELRSAVFELANCVDQLRHELDAARRGKAAARV